MNHHRKWIVAITMVAVVLGVSAGAFCDDEAVDLEQKTITRRSDNDGDYGMSGLVKTLAALALVVALIFLTRFVLVRLTGAVRRSGGAASIEIVSSMRISAKQRIVLIRLGKRLVLVGVSPADMTRLAEVTDADEIAELLAKPAVEGKK